MSRRNARIICGRSPVSHLIHYTFVSWTFFGYLVCENWWKQKVAVTSTRASFKAKNYWTAVNRSTEQVLYIRTFASVFPSSIIQIWHKVVNLKTNHTFVIAPNAIQQFIFNRLIWFEQMPTQPSLPQQEDSRVSWLRDCAFVFALRIVTRLSASTISTRAYTQSFHSEENIRICCDDSDETHTKSTKNRNIISWAPHFYVVAVSRAYALLCPFYLYLVSNPLIKSERHRFTCQIPNATEIRVIIAIYSFFLLLFSSLL